MIGRLVYEVRLIPLKRENRSKIHKKWRWDVNFYITTDPTYPGVETGRERQSSGMKSWGYERYRWQALRKIANCITQNQLREKYVER